MQGPAAVPRRAAFPQALTPEPQVLPPLLGELRERSDLESPGLSGN